MKIDQGNMVITKTVTLHLTPSAWQLYTNMKFVELAADYLNKQVADAFNQCETRNEAITNSEKAFRNVSEFGADDTEPRQVLYSLARKFYGEQS
jgi:hypothetical protein